MPPPVVLGTATLFCRPLRFLFDVERSVPILRNDACSSFSDEKDGAVLTNVHVHLSISIPSDDDAASSLDHNYEELHDLVGRFVHVRVRLQFPHNGEASPSMQRRWRVQYQLSPATESFILPADHTSVMRVLVTDEFVVHVATTALVFSFLPPKQHREEEEEEEKCACAVQSSVSLMVPTSQASIGEAETTRHLTEAAANAAHSAAEAAREAARAATHAMEEAKTLAHQRERERDAEANARTLQEDERNRQQLQYQQQQQRDRAHALELELELERQRTATRTNADAKENTQTTAHALATQQLAHECDRLSEEKQRLCDDAQRLARALDEKDAAMHQWTQQTATTDAAIELLKQRLDADGRERDELQRRLRVLEAEKLELQRKSRACVVQ